MQTRQEKDLLGTKPVPAEAYWGIHTQRALENFKLSRQAVNQSLVRALAKVKKACCLANQQTGHLDGQKANAIATACDRIAAGELADQFPVDALQGGAGTSTNMNVNEVVANLALEILGKSKGCYDLVHPIDDVNLHQSTNDTYPTAVKIAAMEGLKRLDGALARLQGAFQQKEQEFAGIVKIGRTQLQPAVPLTLGAEFSAMAQAFSRDRWRTFKCQERIREINLGTTAIGTGLTAPRQYIFLVCEIVRAQTGLNLCRAENGVDQTANSDAFVEVSGICKATACNITKISSDLRLLHTFGEINLPQMQAGSSIMPGKVNPVIIEAAMQCAAKVEANDFLVTRAASQASLQINELMPLLAHALLESIELLEKTAIMLADHVVKISANKQVCAQHLAQSPALITAFLPLLGYEKATELITEFNNTKEHGNLQEFLEGKLGKQVVDETLSPQKLTALGYR